MRVLDLLLLPTKLTALQGRSTRGAGHPTDVFGKVLAKVREGGRSGVPDGAVRMGEVGALRADSVASNTLDGARYSSVVEGVLEQSADALKTSGPALEANETGDFGLAQHTDVQVTDNVFELSVGVESASRISASGGALGSASVQPHHLLAELADQIETWLESTRSNTRAFFVVKGGGGENVAGVQLHLDSLGRINVHLLADAHLAGRLQSSLHELRERLKKKFPVGEVSCSPRISGLDERGNTD